MQDFLGQKNGTHSEPIYGINSFHFVMLRFPMKIYQNFRKTSASLMLVVQGKKCQNES
jgi:hypothetical protein